MAINRIHIDTTPQRVFDVLAGGDQYGHWVIGAKHIRSVDEAWPNPGARFHHTVGFGPFTVNDHTEALEIDAPRRLLMEARVLPFGRARVELVLTADEDGTALAMTERMLRVPPVVNLVIDPLIHVRNRQSLRRLCRLCEHR